MLNKHANSDRRNFGSLRKQNMAKVAICSNSFGNSPEKFSYCFSFVTRKKLWIEMFFIKFEGKVENVLPPHYLKTNDFSRWLSIQNKIVCVSEKKVQILKKIMEYVLYSTQTFSTYLKSGIFHYSIFHLI